MYVPRNAEKLLLGYLSLFPCVALTGPRQSGKSTMVRHILPDVPYVSFDDPDEELAFHTDPKGFMSKFPGRVILDEVQRVPDIYRYLKMAVDTNPGIMGRFILTGSNQLSFQKGISESLAGRIGLLCLLPFEHAEMPQETRAGQILFGGYPTLATRNNKGAKEWFSSYFATYLEKDLRLVFDLGKLADFQILVRLLAARTSQEQNASSLSREIGVSANTVDKWISVLDAGFLVFSLQSFHANLGKRLIKRPKTYFWDTGLVCHLTGIRDMETLEGGPLAGALFENLVVAEHLKQTRHNGKDRESWFYRDNAGNEIDLLVHDRELRHVSFMEIKSAYTAKAEWAYMLEKTANMIQKAFDAAQTTYSCQIVYRGETRKNWPKTGIDFINVEEFLG